MQININGKSFAMIQVSFLSETKPMDDIYITGGNIYLLKEITNTSIVSQCIDGEICLSCGKDLKYKYGHAVYCESCWDERPKIERDYRNITVKKADKEQVQ